MVKSHVYIIVFILLALYSCSEVNIDSNDEHLINRVTNDIDSTGGNLSEDIAAYKTVVSIIRETGLSPNFVILPGDVDNVRAYIEDNERILEYNLAFMDKLQGDSLWPGISVLARQIGHHLSNHELENGVPNIEEEIEADKYAGFVLYKMGATLDEALKALKIIIGEDSLGGSISKNSRLASLTKGWKNAKTLMSDTLISNEEASVTASIDSSKEVVISPDLIVPTKEKNSEYLYKVFLALDKSMYFVDEENLVFQEIEGKHVVVGSKKESNKPGFDWIFIKGGDSYGVDLKGRLWAFSTDNNFYVVGQSLKLRAK